MSAAETERDALLVENARLRAELDRPLAGPWLRGHAKTARIWTRRDPWTNEVLASARANERAAWDRLLVERGYRLLGEPTPIMSDAVPVIDGKHHLPHTASARELVGTLKLPVLGEHLDADGQPRGEGHRCYACSCDTIPMMHLSDCPAHAEQLAYEAATKALRDAAPRLYTALSDALDNVDRLTTKADELLVTSRALQQELNHRVTKEHHAGAVLQAWIEGTWVSLGDWKNSQTRVKLCSVVGKGRLAAAEAARIIPEAAKTPSMPHLKSRIYADIQEERERQIKRWGSVNHPDVCPTLARRPGGSTPERYANDLEIPTPGRARFGVARAGEMGRMNWAVILVEELAEAVEAAALGERGDLRRELVQVAAVAVAWLESLAARGGSDG